MIHDDDIIPLIKLATFYVTVAVIISWYLITR
jgi:hypothetical protein